MIALMSRQSRTKNRPARPRRGAGVAAVLLLAGASTPMVSHARPDGEPDVGPALSQKDSPQLPKDSPPRNNLRGLEQRVGDLKEQVFRAKARLSLLSERFLRSTAGGGRAVILQKTQMGRLYQPVRITYQLDGREIFSKGDAQSGSKSALTLAPAEELSVWDGGLPPGDHTLSVSVVYRGNGARVFSYFDQYTYTASAAQRFRANDGGITRIRVVCRENGNPALTDLAERPLIEFEVDDGASAKVATKADHRGSP